MSAYAIVKHRLFDIRLVVARSLAYILSVVVVVILYSLLAFGIARAIFGIELTVAQDIYFALFSAVIALAFQPVKRFFDKFTNKYFYRDSYDGQELLNELNSSLVNNSSIEPLLDTAAAIVESKLRPEFCTFGLLDTESGKRYVRGTKVVHASNNEVSEITEFTSKSSAKTIITSNGF